MAENISLTDLVNLTNSGTAVAAINNNNTIIENAFLDVLSLSGNTPNQMQNVLDMNDNQILNLPSPATANSPLRLQDLSTFNGGGTISELPSGGTTGQVLAKSSNTDYAYEWVNATGLSAGTNLSITTGVISTIANPTFSTSVTTPSLVLNGTTLSSTTGSGSVVALAAGPTLTGSITLNGNTTLGSSFTLTVPSVVFTGSSTGVTTVESANASSSSYTITIPAITDTIATLTATQTLTNTTLDGGELTGTISGTPTLSGSNFVTMDNIVQVGAYNLVGNTTGSTADMAGFTIGGLTLKSSPTSSDLILISDAAASGALKYTTIGDAVAGTVAGVSSIASNTGAFTLTNGITNNGNAIELALNSATTQTTTQAPTGTTSTSYVMMGLGAAGSAATITPVYSTRVKVCFTGVMNNSTGSDGAQLEAKYGTSTAPVNGASVTGTTWGSVLSNKTGLAAGSVPFCTEAIITGLTAGVTYWFDIALEAITGGTAAVGNVTFNAMEF